MRWIILKNALLLDFGIAEDVTPTAFRDAKIEKPPTQIVNRNSKNRKSNSTFAPWPKNNAILSN